MINLRNILLVLTGSALGGTIRFIISVYLQNKIVSKFPLGTFVVNLIGCFLIGVIFSFVARNSIGNDDIKLLLATGFCGGFTTFSAFAIENLDMIRNGNHATALTYIILSIILGIIATLLGTFMFK
ncbi:MAG: fluoride efflux transporter CrcB [bacterium]|jgi:CrcB protein